MIFLAAVNRILRRFGLLLTKSTAVIEDNDCLWLPSYSGLEIVARDDVVHEEVGEPTLFGLLETLNLGDEFAVDEEAFLARHGVDPNQWVDGVNGVFADKAVG